MPAFVPRACPVCAEKKSEVMYTHDFAAFKNVSFLKGYDVVCCDSCGCVYADNIPSQEDFNKYYTEHSKYEQSAEWSVEIHDSNAELLSRELPNKDARILDIGCGMGRFLLALQKLGFTNLEGVDPSALCAKYISSKYDIPCQKGTLQELSLRTETSTYDAVALCAVLEHLVSTHEAIETISNLIRRGGLFFITVPNSAAFDPIVNGPYQEFSVEHINYFCLESLLNLFGTFGFKLVASYPKEPAYLACVFRKTGDIAQISKESRSKANIEAYLKKSARLDNHIIKTLEAQCDGKLIVWGTGTLTLRLLASGILNSGNIKVFVDSNPHYIGGSFEGIPVIAPTELKAYTEPILISSFEWHSDIFEKIKNELMLENEIVSLVSTGVYDLN